MVLWLSWLERLVHIEEVIGSSPIKTTKISFLIVLNETKFVLCRTLRTNIIIIGMFF